MSVTRESHALGRRFVTMVVNNQDAPRTKSRSTTWALRQRQPSNNTILPLTTDSRTFTVNTGSTTIL